VLGWLWVGQSDPARNVAAIPANLQLTTLRPLRNLDINFSLLDDPQLQDLRAYGELPVIPGSGGKENPFQ
jgi:hypothetical protein